MTAAAARDGHLLSLQDGTPAHAPPGRLTLDEDNRVACHLCGRGLHHLGAHVRQHGWDADRHREAVGLARRRPLCSATVSFPVQRRQRARWNADPTVRSHFEAGQQAARAGELTSAAAVRRRAGAEPPEVIDTVRRSPERAAATVGHSEPWVRARIAS